MNLRKKFVCSHAANPRVCMEVGPILKIMKGLQTRGFVAGLQRIFFPNLKSYMQRKDLLSTSLLLLWFRTKAGYERKTNSKLHYSASTWYSKACSGFTNSELAESTFYTQIVLTLTETGLNCKFGPGRIRRISVGRICKPWACLHAIFAVSNSCVGSM
jgi:hypothetical protein